MNTEMYTFLVMWATHAPCDGVCQYVIDGSHDLQHGGSEIDQKIVTISGRVGSLHVSTISCHTQHVPFHMLKLSMYMHSGHSRRLKEVLCVFSWCANFAVLMMSSSIRHNSIWCWLFSHRKPLVNMTIGCHELSFQSLYYAMNEYMWFIEVDARSVTHR